PRRGVRGQRFETGPGVGDGDLEGPVVGGPEAQDHRAVLTGPLMGDDRVGGGFADGDAEVLDALAGHARLACRAADHEACQPDVLDVGRQMELDVSGHPWSWSASSRESWMGKTLVRPVMRKILRIRSWLQTSASVPSCART